MFESQGLVPPPPLAERLRPRRIEEVVGQDHLLAAEAPLGRMLAAGRMASLILWGPAGVGKTSLARLLAARAGLEHVAVAATGSGVRELREVFSGAKSARAVGRGTLLFVDEIHRFNRAQQDAFLPVVEDGTVTLVGATTENPSFELNSALLSRCRLMVLRKLDVDALQALLGRAEQAAKRTLPATPEGRIALCAMADGDGRQLLDLAEQALALHPPAPLDGSALSAALIRRAPIYDKHGDEHYNLISALHKSIRASNPDAALYWLARMLVGGEDPRYIARRLVRIASEDVGLADPSALSLVDAAARTYERLGSPEGELALAQATIHLATAPKSVACYRAMNAAMAAARETGSLPPPKNILNAPTRMMRDLGYGQGYQYDPDTAQGVSAQELLPEGMAARAFYLPGENGHEQTLKERMAETLAKRARAAVPDRR